MLSDDTLKGSLTPELKKSFCFYQNSKTLQKDISAIICYKNAIVIMYHFNRKIFKDTLKLV